MIRTNLLLRLPARARSKRRVAFTLTCLACAEQSDRVAALQLEVDALKHQNAVAQEKVFGLEECLTVKDTELQVRDAELNHLR
jgi:hypothetical protein